MASLTFSNALLPLAGTDRAESAASVQPGFFSRFVEALIESRRQAAEREVKRLGLSLGIDLPNADLPSMKVTSDDLPFAG